MAFDAFNKLVKANPERVMRVMGSLAAGEGVQDEDVATAKAARRVLDATGDGRQIGFEGADGDKLWGEVFSDKEHRKAADAYNAVRDSEGMDSEAAKSVSRLRGLHTLRIYAQNESKETEKSNEESAAIAAQ